MERVKEALVELRRSDPVAANHLSEFLEDLFEDIDREDLTAIDEAWLRFHDQMLIMSHPAPTLHPSPPPDSRSIPVPISFQNGRQSNRVTTEKASFVQTLWRPDWNDDTPGSRLALQLARIDNLQSVQAISGGIPVTATPDLNILVGRNPINHAGLIDFDWRAWSEMQMGRARVWSVLDSFDDLISFLPWENAQTLKLIYRSQNRDGPGVWQADPSYDIQLVLYMLTSVASPCPFMPEFQKTTFQRTPLTWTAFHSPSYLPKEWQLYSGLSELDLDNLSSLLMEAIEILELDPDETWTSFFPIVPSFTRTTHKDSVRWSAHDVQIPTPAEITAPAEDGSVSSWPRNQRQTPLIPILDRIVVSDLVSVDTNRLIVVLMNPFAQYFSTLADGGDFIQTRWARLRQVLSTPSSSNPASDSIYLWSLERLRDAKEWAKMLQQVSKIKRRNPAIGRTEFFPTRTDPIIIIRPELLFVD